MAEPDHAAGHQAVEDVARASYGRLVAYLASVSGDLAAAEDALSEAFLAALSTWPVRGVPDRPDAWLVTAARRNLIDAVRRRQVAARALPELGRLADQAQDPGPGASSGIPDKRLELLFACAHPAVDPALHSPLALQAVLGLDAARIGRAFLVPASTMGQRLVRAKAKIKQARIPFRVPAPEELPERLGAVLDAVYAAYGTAWEERETGLAAEALRLAELVTHLLPGEPEAHGLLALILHSSARSAARRDDQGRFVPLDEQDARLWDPSALARAERHLARAVAPGQAGPYALQAAIQSMHNRRALTGTTDWPAIAALYDELVARAPTTGALVARAKAHGEAFGSAPGLELLDAAGTAPGVAGYQPYWVVRCDLLTRAGRAAEARSAADRALELTGDPAVRSHLASRYGLTTGS